MKIITTLNKVFQRIDAATGRRVSMSEIARTTGVSIVTLSRIKNNKVGYIKKDTLQRIISIYPTVDPGDFFERVEEIT